MTHDLKEPFFVLHKPAYACGINKGGRASHYRERTFEVKF